MSDVSGKSSQECTKKRKFAAAFESTHSQTETNSNNVLTPSHSTKIGQNSDFFEEATTENAPKKAKYDDEDSSSSEIDVSKPVKLNVGGKLYMTKLETLLSEKNTYFCVMFSGEYNEKPDPVTGEYFIDRDPKYFATILNHLRGIDTRETIAAMTQFELSAFWEEIKFYCIPSLIQFTSTVIERFVICQPSGPEHNSSVVGSYLLSCWGDKSFYFGKHAWEVTVDTQFPETENQLILSLKNDTEIKSTQQIMLIGVMNRTGCSFPRECWKATTCYLEKDSKCCSSCEICGIMNPVEGLCAIDYDRRGNTVKIPLSQRILHGGMQSKNNIHLNPWKKKEVFTVSLDCDEGTLRITNTSGLDCFADGLKGKTLVPAFNVGPYCQISVKYLV